jgi:hypothetical protein
MVPFLAENRTVPSREFTDETGVLWRVWTTFPSNPKSVATELRDGWLCFDSGEERRRIGPIPRDWEQMTDERLQLVLRLASPSRKTPPKGTPEPNEPEDHV